MGEWGLAGSGVREGVFVSWFIFPVPCATRAHVHMHMHMHTLECLHACILAQETSQCVLIHACMHSCIFAPVLPHSPTNAPQRTTQHNPTQRNTTQHATTQHAHQPTHRPSPHPIPQARELSVEDDMMPVVEFLVSKGLRTQDVVAVITGHPPVLSYRVGERLEPFWAYMQETVGVQVGGGGGGLGALQGRVRMRVGEWLEHFRTFMQQVVGVQVRGEGVGGQCRWGGGAGDDASAHHQQQQPHSIECCYSII